MALDFSGAKSLFSSKTAWTVLITTVLVVAGLFGFQADPEWVVVNDANGVKIGEYYKGQQWGVKAEDAPAGAKVYRGGDAQQVWVEDMANRAVAAIAIIGGIVATLFRFNATKQIQTVLPHGKQTPNYSLALFCGGAVFVLAGCSNAERLEYMAYRDADYNGLSVTRAEQRLNSQVLAGDKNMDGTVTPDEGGQIDLSKLPNLNSLTTEQRNAWLRLRLAELDESEARYRNSKELDEKALSNGGGLFGNLFGGNKKNQPE
jgi:hypothetical protein